MGSSRDDDLADWREEEYKADAVNAALTESGVWVVHDDGRREYVGDFEGFDPNTLAMVMTLKQADWRVRHRLRSHREAFPERRIILAGDGQRLVRLEDARFVRVLNLHRPKEPNKRAGRGDVLLSCRTWKVIRGNPF